MVRVSTEQQLVRRTKLYQLLCQGKTLRAAQKSLKVSEPTVLADLRAISVDLAAWAAEQQNHALAMALATYQRVIDEALAYAAWEHTTEKKWLAGGFDAHQVSEDGTTVVRKAPPLRTNKAALLSVVAGATEKMTRLAGFADHRVELSATVTHEVSDLDDAYARLTDPAERAAFLERVRAADASARALDQAVAHLTLPGAE